MRDCYRERGADISDCGFYRYRLWRIWGDRPLACFVMLNPSTADADVDDATIRRCVGFARSWGCGGVMVVNLFAYRATNPKNLVESVDPVGPSNDAFLAAEVAACNPVVLGWGGHGAKVPRRVEDVLKLIPRPRWCLGITRTGQPKHPLYIPGDTPLMKV